MSEWLDIISFPGSFEVKVNCKFSVFIKRGCTFGEFSLKNIFKNQEVLFQIFNFATS